MMRSFLFSFGFESPTERRSNELSGTDFESSWSVLISSQTADEAMAWGKQIAEAFVQKLYSNAGVPNYSWTAGDFAHGIEELERHVEDVRLVNVGEMPDFVSVLDHFADL